MTREVFLVVRECHHETGSTFEPLCFRDTVAEAAAYCNEQPPDYDEHAIYAVSRDGSRLVARLWGGSGYSLRYWSWGGNETRGLNDPPT